MAREKLEEATFKDLWEILATHGHKLQIVYGLAVAAQSVLSFGQEKEEIEFLLTLLDQEYDLDDVRVSWWANRICVEAVKPLLEIASPLGLSRLGLSGGQLQRLVNFLGQRPPLEGIQGKVRAFLASTSRLMTVGHYFPAAPTTLDRGSVARALLRYQGFDALRMFFMEGRIYEAIPVLFEAVVEQLEHVRQEGDSSKGPSKRSRRIWVEPLVLGGWSAGDDVGRILRLVGSDARALYFLLDLSTAYIEEHWEPYPIEGLRTT